MRKNMLHTITPVWTAKMHPTFMAGCAIIVCIVVGACDGPQKQPEAAPKSAGSYGPMRFVPKHRLATDAPAFPAEALGTGPLPEPSTPEALASAPGEWSIVLASFLREGGEAQASTTLQLVRSTPGLDRAYLDLRGKSVVIAYGSYPSGGDPSAQRDLRRLRELEVNGRRPFETAVIAPPPFSGIAGTIPEYDLSTARQRFGVQAIYTLQVAVYERGGDKEPSPQELQEVRLAAERAAVELRREGELAFYYHGPRRSMATLGLFGDADYDVQRPERESPRLTLLRQKYPYNLVNGATYLVRMRGQSKPTEQPSFVVSVPQ
jgi:hypothetical protein